MSPFARVVAFTIAGAAAAAVVVVGVVALQTEPTGDAAPAPKPRKGVPPLTLELGIRTDSEAVALRRAAQLYAAGKRAAAGRSFVITLRDVKPGRYVVYCDQVGHTEAGQRGVLVIT